MHSPDVPLSLTSLRLGPCAAAFVVLLSAGCGQPERTFQPGNLALMGFLGHGHVQPATPEQGRRCTGLWNRSKITWAANGEASVAMYDGRCFITYRGRDPRIAGALFPCWEANDSIECAHNGVSFEYLYHRFHLHPFKLVWNAHMNGAGHLSLAEGQER